MKQDGKIKVVCAMSGGVDSSVSAALLKKAGFEVIGVFMKFWAEEAQTGACLPENRCCSTESEARARKTALQLEIPFYTLDLRQEFKKMVVERFIADTKAGLTPNPCVVCNQEIKFGLLVDKARGMGADHIATGHYCRIKKTKDGIYHLLKGADPGKDQSYFLWRLDQKQLGRVIFPVGGFDKKEVRVLAKKWRLPSAATPESQEVCFAAGGMEEFLARHCGKNPGNIVDDRGKAIGQHEGLWFYTIGQRKGIKLSGGPFYVKAKDFTKNELLVAGTAGGTGAEAAALADIRWLSGKTPALPLKLRVRIRYRAKEVGAVLGKNGILKFDKPQFAVTPGQSAVFYKGREVLGGGVIV
jgi:tRNA-uridine 2-sulfurtransferase